MGYQQLSDILMNQKTPTKSYSKRRINQEQLLEITSLNDQQLLKADHSSQDDADRIMAQIFDKISNLGNTINRKSFFHCLAIYYYNLAYFHQKKQQSLCAVTAIQNCLKNYQYLKGFLSTRQENIMHSIQLVKVYLQCCAIMSQVGKHSISIIYAEKSLQKLIQCFRMLQALCHEEISLNSTSQKNQTQGFPRMEKVCFKKRVLMEAKKLLDELSGLPLIHKLLSEEKRHLEKITTHIYFWQKNYDQNEKNIRKELEIQNKKLNRNILGIHKANKIAEKFHIGSLMSMKLKKMSYDFKKDRYYLLSSDQLTELVLYTSVSYFTFSTQTRFNELDEDIEALKITDRFEKLNHDNQIKKCKIIHLKAIEIAGKFLPPCNEYFDHLIQSFNKNYKLILDEIEEVSEMCTILEESKNFQLDQPSKEYGIINRTKTKVYVEKSGQKTERMTQSKTKSKKKSKKHSSSFKVLNFK